MKNFQKGSTNIWLIVIIVILLLVVGYFVFAKNTDGTNQQTSSMSEVQNQVPVSTTQSPVTQKIVVSVISQPVGSPSITLISPNGKEVYSRGQTVQIKWNVTNSNDIVRLLLIPGDTNITSFANAAANFTSPYSWTIPANIAPGSYKIKAETYNQNGDVPTLRGFDTSDNYFTITVK